MFIPIIVFIVFFVIFLSIVISMIASHHSSAKDMQTMITTVSAYAEKQLEKSSNQPKSTPQVCEYCGSTINEGDTKCASCGAKVKDKK